MTPPKDTREQFIEGFDDDIGSVMPFGDTITSYGADLPVETIVRRIELGDIYVPDFQRRYIWSPAEASRFIESILLGLPVPGVFLAKDMDGRLMIIDGQQRLLSLYYFIAKSNDREESMRLTGIGTLFDGSRFDDLDEQYKIRLLDSIIHATIVRQDAPNYANSSIFHLFERLNSGGKSLEPQEIRNCLYPGSFQKYLSELNSFQPWRDIYGSESARYQDQELILRFISLRVEIERYAPPLKAFLNNFMGEHRKLEDQRIVNAGHIFKASIHSLRDANIERLFRPSNVFNAAVYDSVTLGVSYRLDQGPISDLAALRSAYEDLLHDAAYQRLYKTSPSSSANLIERVSIANLAFRSVK